MNLSEIEKRVTSDAVNDRLRKTFNYEIDFSDMTPSLAFDMISETRKEIESLKLSNKNTKNGTRYMNALMTVEALEKWITEQKLPKKQAVKEKVKTQPKVTEGFGDSANVKQALRLLVGNQNYNKALRALEMAKAGKSVPANFVEGLRPLLDLIETVMAGSIANTRVLQQLNKRAKNQLGIKEARLNEGEMESAELVLAAKDMVDQLQGMQEDLGELMNENLPPLVDAIRDEMGQDMADKFSQAAKGTLESALDSIESARSGMDGASRVLTGEDSGVDLGGEPADGSDAMEPAGDIDLDAMGDMDADAEPKMDLDSEEGGTEGEPGLDREER
ncbi:MAG: hypothetical protein CBD31_01695 [Flavobacteriaceae bacterium TMED171]|nr:MAG: hypothetical protein CBD31_01695 [Flavobacteriaceae bacterium TMED171]